MVSDEVPIRTIPEDMPAFKIRSSLHELGRFSLFCNCFMVILLLRIITTSDNPWFMFVEVLIPGGLRACNLMREPRYLV